jgi:hypothetical protein
VSGYLDRAVNQAIDVLTFEDAPTPLRVREVCSAVVTMFNTLHSGEALEVETVAQAVETKCDIFVPRPVVLSSPDDHREWLQPNRGSIEWRFWDRYSRYLRTVQGLAPRVVDRLDDVTDLIVGLLEDPKRQGPWDTRGLVVGQVQSGKTANYTGLVCKAADAGYRLIVVLAGVHNSLRSQTQLRLDLGFVGFDTQRRRLFRSDNPRIGVGALADSPTLAVHALTDSGERGDFGLQFSKQANINIRGSDPVLLVVKKNASILKNLISWSTWLADTDSSGRPVVGDVPLLLIDDEADHASVNTSSDVDDPTKINGLIRRLLSSFDRSSYIGYTATPFANIFIDESDVDAAYGKDLFPQSFIVGLQAPSNYMGPSRVFGLLPDSATGSEATAGLPVVRTVQDHATWLPDRHRPRDEPGDELPDSLRRALHSFILVCAAREVRGHAPCHNSMLVHVTRFVAVQALVAEQLSAEVRSIERRIRYGDGAREHRLIDELRELWETDFIPTTLAMDSKSAPAKWTQIEAALLSAASRIVVIRLNGSANNDVLSYVENNETGISVIAIGGDKLSRGLTLEGLSVSYYLRASRMYDTLLQMGRWFGFRPGYEDLCRLYTTAQLVSWYEQITLADEELRQEFEVMVAQRRSPRDYGLRIREHPDGLLITAPSKMRSGRTIQLSFSAVISETVTFDSHQVDGNLRAADAFVRRLGEPTSQPSGRFVWSEVGVDTILEFLSDYRTADASAAKVRADVMAQYIAARARDGELISWTVGLLAGGRDEAATVGGREVRLTHREWIQGEWAIKRLLSPRDEELDLSREEIDRARHLTLDMLQETSDEDVALPTRSSGRALREVRPPRRGLLLIYPLSRANCAPVIGIGISFPRSDAAENGAVAYKINRTLFKQLFLDLDLPDAGDGDD